MLEIRFLGECQFTYNDKILTGLQTKRLRSLLGFLLLHSGQQLSNTQLAFLFWPDSSEKQARTNLRRQFYNLRNAFPESQQFLIREDHTVLWRTDTSYVLDVAQFEDQLAAAQKVLEAGDVEAACTALEKAIGRYRGELLPDCYDDWILPIRERLRQDYLSALSQLITLREDGGDYPAAIRHSELLLQQDPLLEKSYRQLVRLHTLNGDRASALRTYHLCVSTLERELGVEPHSETTAAYKRLLKVDEQPVSVNLSAVRHQTEVTQLVGRQRERKQLLTIWRQASFGEAKFVLISGEAGIGKTRLAEELVYWVSQLGIDVAKTRSFPAAGELPYAPVIEWLRTETMIARYQQLEAIWIIDLLRLVPDLQHAHGDLPVPQPLSEGWQRQRLFEAMSRAFSDAQQPLLLWIDDLQWCDRETLSWFQYLMQFASDKPLLLLGTARLEEADFDHPLTELLDQLRHSAHLIEIILERLNAEETTELAGHVGNAQLSTSMAQKLYEDSEGNPLFAIEMMRNMIDTDGVSSSASSDHSNPGISSNQDQAGVKDESTGVERGLALPSKVYHVIRSRLSRLSPAAYQLSGLAASIGRSFQYRVLAEASDMDESALMLSLDELWRRRIVREQSSNRSGYSYDFSHDRIRDVAYSELSAIRRRHYHHSIAQALDRVYGDDIAEWSAQIARHYQQAGLHAQARDYYRMAGERAASQFAHTDALTYFSWALDWVDQQAFLERFELHSLMERVYHVQTERALQQDELDKMMTLASRLKDSGKCATVYLRKAECAEGQGDYNRAIEFANQAVQSAREADDLIQETKGTMQIGSVFWNQGDYLRSEDQFQQALPIAQKAGERMMEATVLLHLGALQSYIGDHQEAKQVSQQALDVALELDNTECEIWARNQLGFQIIEQGDDDYAEAKVHLTRGLTLAKKMGHRAYIAKLSSNLAMMHDRLGEYEAALACLEESLAIAKETGSTRHRAFALNYRGNTLAHRGEFDDALTQFEEALTLFQQIGYRQGEGKTLSELALIHIWQGDPHRALKQTEQALAIAGQINIQRDQAYALTRRGYAYEGLSDWRSATESYTEALAIYRSTGQKNRRLEPLAGLTRIALAAEDLVHALHLSESILNRIQTYELDATHEAFWVYVTCWQTFHAADDHRMTELLHKTHSFLAQRFCYVPTFLHRFENETELDAFRNAFGTPPTLS